MISLNVHTLRIHRSFLICWSTLFLFGSLVLVLCRLLAGPDRRGNEILPSDYPEISVRAGQVAAAVTETWTKPHLHRITGLGALLDEASRPDSTVLIDWLAGKKEIASAVVWYRNRDLPLRIINDDFREYITRLSMSAYKEKEILDFIYPAMNERPAGATDLFSNRQLLKNGMNIPIVSLGTFLPDSRTIQAVEICIVLDTLDALLHRLSRPGENSIITDTADAVLAGRGPGNGGVRFSHTEAPSGGRTGPLSFSTDLPFLPWRIHMQSELTGPAPAAGPHSSGIPGIVFILIGLTGILVVSGFTARVVSGRLDKPVETLVDTVSGIARGNFQKLIPPLEEPQLNRLVKVFNYMAGEMERFQDIDVYDIISRKNKVETILRNIADGVVVTDQADNVIIVNEIIEKWFDIREKHVIGSPVNTAVKIKELPELIQRVRGGSTAFTAEFSYHVPGFRKPKTFHAHAANLTTADGSSEGVVTIIRDITKDKEADKIKTELISMVAHELKSPLTSIYGFSELLLDSDMLEDQAKEYAQVILNESSRLTELVNKFLDLSRLEAGKTEINMMPFDLKQLVKKIITVHQGLAARKNIRIIPELPANLPLASGDQDFIEQVIVNLYSNAVKYSPVNSKIGIELKLKKDRITVSVIDNGYGIPKEALPHIFNKFYRVTEGEEADQGIEGSGLGLALAREIVEQHGSTIKVNSKLGVGSVFSFSIPTAEIH